MQRVVYGLILICSIAVAQAASAQIPAACSGLTNSRAYRAGNMAGSSLVRQSWAALNDCDRVEQFEELVMSSLERYTPSSSPTPYTQCRFAGVINGILDQLDGVFIGCSDACFEEGQFAGELSAFAYCELSIALNGLATADEFLRGPVQVCGLSFEVGCDTQFVATSSSYENEMGSCEPFTRSEFAPVFDQIRENQCAYNPIDPEELDANEQTKGSAP